MHTHTVIKIFSQIEDIVDIGRSKENIIDCAFLTVDPSCRRQNNKKLNWFLISSWNRVLNNKLNNSNCQPRLALWLCKVMECWVDVFTQTYEPISAQFRPSFTWHNERSWNVWNLGNLIYLMHSIKKKKRTIHFTRQCEFVLVAVMGIFSSSMIKTFHNAQQYSKI